MVPISRFPKLEFKGRWSGCNSKGRALLGGDSLVGYIDRELCHVDKANKVQILFARSKDSGCNRVRS